jgi:phage-related protein|tara:strand:- start:165 stop:401 length:237 start_codon:yes stop_codon:yes gene_type:complete
VTKKDMENILQALGEASFAGLCRFVFKSKMDSIIEVVHCFDKDKFTPGTELPAVRIIIEPIKEEEAQDIEQFRNNLIN